MDTSSRFTSARLRAVKRENNIRAELTPREYAQLIFDEIEDMERPIFDLLFKGSESGVKIDWGKRTISYAHLEMSSSDFVGISASRSPLISDNRPRYEERYDSHRNHLWGLLMIKREGRQLLWVKARELQRKSEIIKLTPEHLAELLEQHKENIGNEYVMYGPSAYRDLANLVVHRANHYGVLANKLLVKATQMRESLAILDGPLGRY